MSKKNYSVTLEQEDVDKLEPLFKYNLSLAIRESIKLFLASVDHSKDKSNG